MVGWAMKLIKQVVAVAYGLAVVYLVFFARRRRHIEERYLNLVPVRNTVQSFIELKTGTHKEAYNFYTNLAGNMLLFLPLPFLLVLFFKIRDSKTSLGIALASTLFIELMQYTFKIGVADIDDVLLNMLGAASGFGLLKLMESNVNTKVAAQ